MNEDTLILYYYNDGLSDRERQQVETAINADPVIATRYEALCRQLNDLRATNDQVVPSHTLHRWHDSIDQAARQNQPSQKKPAGTFNLFSFVWGAAITAALVTKLGIAQTRKSVIAPCRSIQRTTRR